MVVYIIVDIMDIVVIPMGISLIARIESNYHINLILEHHITIMAIS